MLDSIKRRLCHIGVHRWAHVSGLRHWHMECRWCERREVWMNADPRNGYQPYDPNWGEAKKNAD